jgi:hypothetical protein
MSDPIMEVPPSDAAEQPIVPPAVTEKLSDISAAVSEKLPDLPPAVKEKLPSEQDLRRWLPLYLKKTDAVVSRVNQLLTSSPADTDRFLCTLQYSTLAAGSILSDISVHKINKSVLNLICLAGSLPENTTVIIEGAPLPATKLLRFAQSLKALSALVSDFRIFVRLWGLLGIWAWGKGLINNPPQDVTLKRIAWSQVAVNVAYQVLENGAYLSSKGVMGWDVAKQNRAWVWSSRFWAAHVVLEFGRLGYVRRQKAVGKGAHADTVVEDDVWSTEMTSNLAYAPLTVHWSKETGIMGDFWVGVLGTIAGGAGLLQKWKKTA